MAFRTVGVEIGSSAVRAAEMVVGQEVPSLAVYGEVPLPPRAVMDGEVADRVVVRERLRQLWSEGGFSQNRVTVGIAGLRAIIREFEVPPVPDKEMEDVVRFQAAEVIPFPPEKTLLSSRTIGDSVGPDGTPTRSVLVGAAHRDLVEPVIEILGECGLTATAVDLTSLALVRIARQSMEPVVGAQAIVSIGAGLTVVVIEEGGIATFVRTIGQGGDQITEAIASVLDAPFQDAEQIKANLNLPGQQYMTAGNAARDATVGLINEIKSSVDYYATIGTRSEVLRVVVTGGSSLLDGFLPRLQQQFKIPVVPLHPLARIDTSNLPFLPEDLARRESAMATALGLALPEPAGVKPINLLPPEIRSRATEARNRKRALLVGALVVVVLVAVSVLRFVNVQSSNNKVTKAAAQIASLTVQVNKANKTGQLKTLLQAVSQQITPVLQAEVNWPAAITAIANPAYGPPAAPLSGIYVMTETFSAISPSGATASAVSSNGSSQLMSNGKAIPATDVIASVSVTVNGYNGYNDFNTWLSAMVANPDFTEPVVTSISCLGTVGTSFKNCPITFSTQFDLTTGLASGRANQFAVSGPSAGASG